MSEAATEARIPEGRVTLSLVLQEVRRSEDRTTKMVEALQQRMELLFKEHGQTHEKHDGTHEKHDKLHEAEESRRAGRIRWVVTVIMSGAVGMSGWAAYVWR